MADRESYTKRSIPFMVLSNGSAASKTAPPQLPASNSVPAQDRALARFQVLGSAIITGGAGNLALSAARALLEHGSSGVMLFDLASTFQASQHAVDQLRTDFPHAQVATQVVDVTDAEAVDKGAVEAERLLGDVRHVLCFAGIVDTRHALEMTPEQYRKVVDINSTGSFLCAQAAAKIMVRHGRGGSVVLIASISGHRVNYPQPQVAYNVSKAAVIAMRCSLAAEWAVHGIRVNTISPGYMDTILNEGAGLEELRKIWASRCPMGRMGAIDELNGAVVLLCSRAGSYMTGADIVIDGGATVF